MAALWARYKDELEQFYLKDNLNVSKIVEVMEEKHSFKRSKPQYERQFRNWGFRKNRTRTEWKAVGHSVRMRDPSKRTNIYIGLDLIDLQTAQRKLARHATPPRLLQEPQSNEIVMELDQTLIYACTPPESSTSIAQFLRNLPWIRFHSLVESNTNPHLDLGTVAINAVTQSRDRSDVPESSQSGLAFQSISTTYLSSLLPSQTTTSLSRQEQIAKLHKHLRGLFPDTSEVSLTWAPSGTGLIKLDGFGPQFSLFVYLLCNGLLDFNSPLARSLEYVEELVDKRYFKSFFSNKEPTIQALLEYVLRAAIKSQNVKVTEAALDSGGNSNLVLRSGETALGYAILRGNKEIFQLLINTGADVNIRFRRTYSQNGFSSTFLVSPLECAASTGNTEMFQELLDANAKPDFSEFSAVALFRAVEKGNTGIAKFLLDAGVRDRPDIRRKTSLEVAIENQIMDLVVLLVDAGADVNGTQYCEAKRPLEAAAEQGNIGLVKFLLSRGADINVLPDKRRYQAKTALQVAAWTGNLDLVKFLVDAGADIHAPAGESHGITALQAAASKGHLAIVAFLLTHGFRTHVSKIDAATSILEAAIKCDAFDIESWIKTAMGVGLKGVDEEAGFQNCISYRVYEGRYDINIEFVRLLLKGGANVSGVPGCLAAAAAKLRYTNIDMITLLLDARPLTNVGRRDLVDALVSAIMNHDITVIQKLLELLSESLTSGYIDLDSLLKAELLHTATSPWDWISPFQEYYDNSNGGHSNNAAMVRIVMDASCILQTDARISTLSSKQNGSGCLKRNQEIEHWGEFYRWKKMLQRLRAIVKDNGRPRPERTQIEALQAATRRWIYDSDIILRMLLGVVGDVDICEDGEADIYGHALQQACFQSNLSMVQVLIDAGANVNTPALSPGRETALQIALSAMVVRVDIVQLLLHSGADVNAPVARTNNRTALQRAVQRTTCDTKLVKLLLEAGADVNAPAAPISGSTALQEAVQWTTYNAELVKLLLDAGADVNAPASPIRGRTALQAAVKRTPYNVELVKLLLEAGADVNAPASPINGRTALQAAVERTPYNAELVKLLLEAGADVNAPASPINGRTALQAAVEGSPYKFNTYNPELIQTLLDAGADLNTPAAPNHGITALQAAAIHGYLGLAARFVELGADVNAPRSLFDGRTALEGAAEYGRIDTVQFLLNAGAELGEPGIGDGISANRPGRTFNAMSLAKDSGHMAIFTLIKDHFGL